MKRLIAGLMCMFTEFKVSRKQLWTRALLVAVGIIIIEGIFAVIVPDNKQAQSVVNNLFYLSTTIFDSILIFGRQNDAGVKGLRRFNPFTNIKIMFCKTA